MKQPRLYNQGKVSISNKKTR